MNIFDRIINEVDYKGVVRKQRSINRLFPDWKDKVKGIAKLGGLRMKSSNSKEWYFQVHSGTDAGKWYDDHLKFKNIPEMLAKFVPDRRLWVKDGSRIDRRKLAKKVLYNVDMALGCSCPAQLYWGGAYITSLPKYAANYENPETRDPKIRNPKKYGMVCKHLQNLLNVLPFYENTMAQWLTQFYDKDIKRLEQQASTEYSKYKDAGKALGKLQKDVQPNEVEPTEPQETETPTEIERPKQAEKPKQVKKPTIRKPEVGKTIRARDIRKRLKDKGVTESLNENNFFRYLIHDTSSEEAKQNILKNGFRLSDNPYILKGVYTQPDIWYTPASKFSLKIFLKNSAKIFDNGADRPMEALRGLGSIEFNHIYSDLLIELGYDIQGYATSLEDVDWYNTNRDTINSFMDNNEDRKKYMVLLRNWLLTHGYSVYINGGEVIIIDLDAIYQVSSLNESITDAYCGLPAGGFYKSNTEYEIGAQIIAEAAHCIAGSVIRALDRGSDWGGLNTEREHIEEELEIIRKAIDEYMKPIYIEQLKDRGIEDKFVKASLYSMREGSQKLYQLANDTLSELSEIEDPNSRRLIEDSLRILVALSLAVIKSLDHYPNIEVSAFIDRRLLRAYKTLEQTVSEVFVKPKIEESFQDRLGQCYVLSGRYVMDHPEATLVHGTVNGERWSGKDFDNPHAWVEIGDDVFDPVMDTMLDKDIYYQVMQAVPRYKYTRNETMLKMIRAKHWGPWDDEGQDTVDESSSFKGTELQQRQIKRGIYGEAMPPITPDMSVQDVAKIAGEWAGKEYIRRTKLLKQDKGDITWVLPATRVSWSDIAGQLDEAGANNIPHIKSALTLAGGIRELVQRYFDKVKKETKIAEKRSWEGFPLRQDIGESPTSNDIPPERTPEGDFILYHATCSADDILRSNTLLADDIGKVGVGTTPESVNCVLGYKKGKGEVLRLVVDKDWVAKQTITHEGSDHSSAFLIGGIGTRTSIPSQAIKSIKLLSSKITESWQKIGRRVYSKQVGKYLFTIRPHRSISNFGKDNAVFIEELWPGESNVWKNVEIINNVGSVSQAKKVAEEWIRKNILKESNMSVKESKLVEGVDFVNDPVSLRAMADKIKGETKEPDTSKAVEKYTARDFLFFSLDNNYDVINQKQGSAYEFKTFEDWFKYSRGTAYGWIEDEFSSKIDRKSIDHYAKLEKDLEKLTDKFFPTEKKHFYLQRAKDIESSRTVKESNTFRIVSSNSYGDLKILSSKGVKYLYHNINPFIKRKVENFLKYKQYGKAWNLLKNYDVEKLENADSKASR